MVYEFRKSWHQGPPPTAQYFQLRKFRSHSAHRQQQYTHHPNQYSNNRQQPWYAAQPHLFFFSGRLSLPIVLIAFQAVCKFTYVQFALTFITLRDVCKTWDCSLLFYTHKNDGARIVLVDVYEGLHLAHCVLICHAVVSCVVSSWTYCWRRRIFYCAASNRVVIFFIFCFVFLNEIICLRSYLSANNSGRKSFRSNQKRGGGRKQRLFLASYRKQLTNRADYLFGRSSLVDSGEGWASSYTDLGLVPVSWLDLSNDVRCWTQN